MQEELSDKLQKANKFSKNTFHRISDNKKSINSMISHRKDSFMLKADYDMLIDPTQMNEYR